MFFVPPAVPVIEQIPLIQIVHEDDLILLSSPDAEWFRILNFLPWKDYRETAAQYYDALYDFNRIEALKRDEKASDTVSEPVESEEDAKKRLLSGRATVNRGTPVLYEPEFRTPAVRMTNPQEVAPGIVPFRSDGRKPKCFFALFKSFIGTSLAGLPPEPENVHFLLTSNLSFARVCGFVPKEDSDQYWQENVPGLRKLEQFDQIMTEYGLWDHSKKNEVAQNIREEVIRKESRIVGDTTHYNAFSGFETVIYEDEKGKEKKKSQSKVTKKCRCEDRENCCHPWELSDDGAGTIVKSTTKIIWGHKASIIGLPGQEIPLDAAAVSDAATYDGQTFFPHTVRLFEDFPEVRPWIDTALYDAACCDQGLKDMFQKELNVVLMASFNPRGKKDVTEDIPRGMEKITPYGIPVCKGGHDMDYTGKRNDTGTFIYKAPSDETGISVCLNCEHKQECCPNSDTGRTIAVPFGVLPHIDHHDPPMAKRFREIMKKRTSVERMIKRLKCDLSDGRLTKRSNASFQAYLDKTMIAFHILLRN